MAPFRSKADRILSHTQLLPVLWVIAGGAQYLSGSTGAAQQDIANGSFLESQK